MNSFLVCNNFSGSGVCIRLNFDLDVHILVYCVKSVVVLLLSAVVVVSLPVCLSALCQCCVLWLVFFCVFVPLCLILSGFIS